jgi:hypothetical protein
VESIKPGSGQGIAKCFAYVKRTKGGEPVQVGKRWTALAVIPEIDTLTAAGAMTGSSLWAEFRSAWSDERVGHDYTDATKTVILQPCRYRLCMIVGVQPLRAQPLFDDIDAGSPQRFVWFPTSDPAAPDERRTRWYCPEGGQRTRHTKTLTTCGHRSCMSRSTLDPTGCVSWGSRRKRPRPSTPWRGRSCGAIPM